MSFKIIRNDIVKMNTEAIVNTANNQPCVGTGCDHAIYTAAGFDALLQYRKEKVGCVEEGDVFITPGFNLMAKYIIHAVSPLFHGGDNEEEEKLRSCYRKSLELAKETGIKSIAFPLISTGGFGYPKEEGMRIALDEINSFLLNHEMEVYLVVYDTKATMLGERVYQGLEAYIDHNYVEEKLTDERSVSRVAKSSNLVRFESVCEECECSVSSIDYEDQLDELKSKLDKRKEHLPDTFSEYLMYLIQERGMTNAEVYKCAIVDKKLFAKIKNDPNYHPQKLTCLCLCVGAKLNLDETKDLLARAGYALSPCDMRDVIFSYFIENEIYDMVELDITLEEYDIPCIIV